MKEISIANGFKLRKVDGTEKWQDFVIEYLVDGELFSEGECKVRITSSEELRKLRKKLLLERIGTLNVDMECLESVKVLEQQVLLGAINDFKIEESDIGESENKNVKIEFLQSGLTFTQREFENVQPKKIGQIKKQLIDNTRYNLRQVQQCRTITILDFCCLLEGIIEK